LVRFNGKKKRHGGTLPLVLRSLESEGDVEKALSSYVGKLGSKDQTVLLRQQGSWERVVRVFNCIRSQKDYVPNVIHYNVVLQTLCRARRWDELRLCWNEMAENGVLPTNNTYSMLISEYGKAGLVSESLLWIKHMKAREIFPDEVTMSTIVKVLKDAGEFDRADRFYRDWCVGKVDFQSLGLNDMNEFGSKSHSKPITFKHFLSMELSKIGGRNLTSNAAVLPGMENDLRKPQLATTFNTLIDLYGKAGRLNDAAEVFAEMLNAGVAPDTYTFNTLIHIYGSSGNLTEAEAFLNKMEERGVSPDTKTYNTFFSLYAEAGNVNTALQCYWKIRNAGLFPDVVTHTAVLNMLCEKQLIQEVETVLLEMEKCNLNVPEHSVPVIIKMYVSKGLLVQARTFFEKCQVHGGLSSKTYAAIMDVYAEKGLYAEAEAVFHAKRDQGREKRDVVEYTVMIKAYGKGKRYRKAFSIFKAMRNSGTWPNECTYNSLIQMFAGGNLVDWAKKVLNQMREAGLKPHYQTYSAIIASYVRQGRLADAVRTFQQMEGEGVKANEVVYGALINGFAEAGRTEEALHYYRKLEDRGIRANRIVLTSLLKGYSKRGYIEGAKVIHESLKKFDGGPDIVASNIMISLYAYFGIVSEAEVIFNNLRQKGQADGATYAVMMKLYQTMGLLNESTELAEEMRQSGLLTDQVSFGRVIAYHAANGQLADCGKLLHEMLARKIMPNMKTFNVLFKILNKGGIPRESLQQLKMSYQERKPYAREAVITCVFSVGGLHAFALESCNAFMTGAVPLDRFAYNVAIYAYGACGQTDRAFNLFMRMKDGGFEPDIVTYNYLVDCYGRANIVEGVKWIYSLMKYHKIEASESLYNAIVNAYRNANRPDLAKLVSREKRSLFESNQYSVSDIEGEYEQYSESDIERQH